MPVYTLRLWFHNFTFQHFNILFCCPKIWILVLSHLNIFIFLAIPLFNRGNLTGLELCDRQVDVLFKRWILRPSLMLGYQSVHISIFSNFHILIFSFFSRRKLCDRQMCCPKGEPEVPLSSLALMPGYLFPPLPPPPTRGQTIAEIWKTIIKEIWNRKGKPLTDSLTQWPIHKIFGGEIPQIPDYTSNQHASSCNTKRRNKTKTKIHEE